MTPNRVSEGVWSYRDMLLENLRTIDIFKTFRCQVLSGGYDFTRVLDISNDKPSDDGRERKNMFPYVFHEKAEEQASPMKIEGLSYIYIYIINIVYIIYYLYICVCVLNIFFYIYIYNVYVLALS